MAASPFIGKGTDPRAGAAAILHRLEREEWISIPVSHLGKRRAQDAVILADRRLGADRALIGHFDFSRSALFGRPGFWLRLRIAPQQAVDAYLASADPRPAEWADPRAAFVEDPLLSGSAVLAPCRRGLP